MSTKVQIDETLFADLALYHLLGERDPDLEARIISALEAKATSMLQRQEYTQRLKKKDASTNDK